MGIYVGPAPGGIQPYEYALDLLRRGVCNEEIARVLRLDARFRDADALQIACWIQFNRTWRDAFEAGMEHVNEDRMREHAFAEADRELEAWLAGADYEWSPFSG